MATSEPAKKVVQSTETAAPEPTWQPKPEDRAKANQLRLFAIILWVLAIALECVVIFGLLFKQPDVPANAATGTKAQYHFLGHEISQTTLFVLCIVFIVICGVLAIVASQLWKKANRLDPASTKEPMRFFIQNQLGAIISVVAFLPLVILVLLSKNLQGAQKGIVAAVAVVVLGATFAAGVTTNPPSQEQYATETAFVIAHSQTLTDEVYWVKSGSTYHLCQQSTDLQHNSQDDQIYSGTVGQAHAAGMSRLAMRNECGFDNSNNQWTAWVPNAAATTAPQPTDSPS